MSVLIITDDTHYAHQLEHELGSADGPCLEIHTVVNVSDAIQSIEARCPKLIVVCPPRDRSDPVDLCATLREASPAPLLMLAPPNQSEWTVEMLQAGADECIVEPVGHLELLARIRALLRRGGDMQEAHQYYDGVFAVDTRLQRACRGTQSLHLSTLQNRLLTILLERRGQAVPYEELTNKLWPDMPNEQARQQLTILVHALRGKIEQDPSSPKYIATRRKVGYAFDPQTPVDPYQNSGYSGSI